MDTTDGLLEWLTAPKDEETLLSNCIDKVTPLLSYEMANHFGYEMKERGFLSLSDWILVYASSAAMPPCILEDLFEIGLRLLYKDMGLTGRVYPLDGAYQCKKILHTLLVNFYKVMYQYNEQYITFQIERLDNGKWQMLLCFCSED